jgi:hypothetical protein
MPNKKEKQEPNNLFDSSMQRAYSKVSKEMPNVKKVNVSPRESSLMTRMFMPRGANAVTNPFTGNISYNPEMMRGMNPDELEQTMAHELTHVGQTQNTPWWKTAAEIIMPDEKVPPGQAFPKNDPYYWRPREMEAFQAERDRASRLNLPNPVDPVLGTRDIQLRPDIGPSSGMIDRMSTRPLYSDKEVSPELVKNRDYYKRK